ncbi:MAG: hypothetical protein JO187_01905 [Acidobacteria bacterium]|nr:hypothetical protein [Acidobacteriota bacterium]
MVATPITVPLEVPVGTPLKITVDKDVRIHKVGQIIKGRVAEPVYAFDRLVIPAGTEATGQITEIGDVPNKVRVLAAMNADFSPTRKVGITFDELQFSDGRRMAIHTDVSPGSNGVLQLVAANAKNQTRTAAARNAASRHIAEAKQQLHDSLDAAKAQLHEPGKLHRLERLGLRQLPYRPQYLDAGTTFNADLQQPLAFGTESFARDALSSLGTAPKSAVVVHADLATPLSSVTSKKDDRVVAVLTQPVISESHLLFPEGSRLEGTVVQVRHASRFGRNGLLRVEFRQIVPPDGVAQKVAASLEAVEVAQREHLALDSEGGAQVVTPKTRYFNTALSLALAAASVSPDRDASTDLHGGAEGGNGAVAGASGFRLVGTFLGAFAHSRALTGSLGFYGAGMSVYSNFLAKGREVIYPKDMTMVVGLGASDDKSPAATAKGVEQQ